MWMCCVRVEEWLWCKGEKSCVLSEAFVTHHWDVFLLVGFLRLLRLLFAALLLLGIFERRKLRRIQNRLNNFLARWAVNRFATHNRFLVHRLMFLYVMLLNHLDRSIAERVFKALGLWRSDWWRFCCRNCLLLWWRFARFHRLLDRLFHDRRFWLQALNGRLRKVKKGGRRRKEKLQ